MSYKVIFGPLARTNLRNLYHYIADNAGPLRAMAYIQRIEAACLNLRDFPHRGMRRNDVRPGLRITGFERRVAIAFTVGADTVTILAILANGQTAETAFPRPTRR